MIDTLTHKNIADFKQRYQGVMGWFSPDKPDQRRAVYVSNVSPSRVTFRDEVGNDYFSNVDTGVLFEFLPTQRAWYNTANNVFLVHRIPARQWKRGVCMENTSIQEVESGRLTGAPLNMEWRQAAFAIMSATVPYEKAVASFLEDGRSSPNGSSVALSRHFAIAGSAVYFLSMRAGTYVAQNKAIGLQTSHKMLEQELQDLIRRNGYNLKVV